MKPSCPAPTATLTPSTLIPALPGGMSSVQPAWAANARGSSLSSEAAVPSRSPRSRAFVGAGIATAIIEVISAYTVGVIAVAIRIASPVRVPRHGRCRVVVGSLDRPAWWRLINSFLVLPNSLNCLAVSNSLEHGQIATARSIERSRMGVVSHASQLKRLGGRSSEQS
jgi:hypothetical protein